jgi:hypothetical protein
MALPISPAALPGLPPASPPCPLRSWRSARSASSGRLMIGSSCMLKDVVIAIGSRLTAGSLVSLPFRSSRAL